MNDSGNNAPAVNVPQRNNGGLKWLLIAVFAGQFIIIVVLVAIIFMLTTSIPSSLIPITTSTDTLTNTPTATPTTSPSESVTVTQTPAANWKTLSESYTHTPSGAKYKISGSVPSDTLIDGYQGDSPSVSLSNNNFALDLSFPQDSGVRQYSSYKNIGSNSEVGPIYKVTYTGESSLIVHYVSGQIETGTSCAYTDEKVPAPCGSEVIVHEGANENILAYATCTASSDKQSQICDVIMKSLQIEKQ